MYASYIGLGNSQFSFCLLNLEQTEYFPNEFIFFPFPFLFFSSVNIDFLTVLFGEYKEKYHTVFCLGDLIPILAMEGTDTFPCKRYKMQSTIQRAVLSRGEYTVVSSSEKAISGLNINDEIF